MKCSHLDITQYDNRVRQAIKSNQYEIITLANPVTIYPYLVQPKYFNRGPNVLIAAGFHGDEPSGSWAILQMLEKGLSAFNEQLNITFIPRVNPTGLCKGKRTNFLDQDPNRGFYPYPRNHVAPSREGRVLLRHIQKLLLLAKDGFLSLHEDIEMTDSFYIYSFEQSEQPTKFTLSLRDCGHKYFNPLNDGEFEGANLHHGIIYKHHDTSFEDFLFQKGIPRTACTEVPGQQDIENRIKASISFIEVFTKVVCELTRL